MAQGNSGGGKKPASSKSSSNTRKGSSSANKKTNSSAEKKTPAEKKNKGAAGRTRKEEIEKNEKHSRITAATWIFALAALLFALVVIRDKNGTPWFYMQSLCFGIFGVCAYIFPLIVAYLGYSVLKGTNSSPVWKNILVMIVMVSCMSAMFFVFTSSGKGSYQNDVANSFYSYINTGKVGSGAVGAAIGSALLMLSSSKIPAIIIISVLLIVCFIYLAGLSLSDVVEANKKTDEEKAEEKAARDIRKDEAERRRTERKNERKTERAGYEKSSGMNSGYTGYDFDETDYQIEKVMRSNEMERNRSKTRKPSKELSASEAKDISDDEKNNISAADINAREAAEALKSDEGEIFGDLDYRSLKQKNKAKAIAAGGKKTSESDHIEPESEDEETPETESQAENYENTEETDDSSLDEIARRAAETYNISNQAQTESVSRSGSGPEEEKTETLTKQEIKEAEKGVEKEIEKSEKTPVKYNYPTIDLLRMPVRNPGTASQSDMKATGKKLIEALDSFNVKGTIENIVPGPSVTRYEVKPAPGVKINKFTGLSDDIALCLAAPAGVRIEAPIPNKSTIGIEIPNRGRQIVTMREIVDTDVYRKASEKSELAVALGKDISGNVITADIAKMPHLLVAGTTGSGKSVCLNAMIVSLLYNASPDEVKILLIDPKQVEFAVYNGIPHLLVPVVSDPRKAAGALAWAVTEMENRYNMFMTYGVRNIDSYNKLAETRDDLEHMPKIVIFIDELSDLMTVAPADVETSIMRLSQKARAAGMHLVVATQRPSVDVITGVIKANIPSRIALSVSSQVDSRTILDQSGAEKLLGLGDMLFLPEGRMKPTRIQGCYLSDSEIDKICSYVKDSSKGGAYSDEVEKEIEKAALSTQTAGSKKSDVEKSELSDADKEIINKAALFVIENPDKASISALQRYLSLGFSKAGRTMDALEERGVVGPHNGSKPREVRMSKGQWYEYSAQASGKVSSSDSENEDYSDSPDSSYSEN